MNIVSVITNYIQNTILTVKGDIMKRGALINARLPIGASKQALRVNDAGDDLEYGSPNTIEETNGDILKCKVVDIGDWNMDTTASVVVAHGLSLVNIIFAQAFIIKDGSSYKHPIDRMYLENDGISQGTIMSISSTDVVITRLLGGLFDDANYDDTGFNRGSIIIWYIA